MGNWADKAVRRLREGFTCFPDEMAAVALRDAYLAGWRACQQAAAEVLAHKLERLRLSLMHTRELAAIGKQQAQEDALHECHDVILALTPPEQQP